MGCTLGSAFGVVSCTAREKHERDDKDELDHNQDLGILNDIKQEVKQTFEAWWDTKATIDINDYPDQIPFVAELVDELKKENDGLTLTDERISKYRFLTQLLTGFKVEFANLNQSLRDLYSNYYVDTMPLFLDEDNILFTLYNINFDNTGRLLKDTPQEVLGITVQVNIDYEVRFKGLPARDKINALVVITNDLDVLSKLQDNIEEYFTMFVNKVLKDQKFQIRVRKYIYEWHPSKIIWLIVREALKNENILFFGSNLSDYKSTFFMNSDSMSFKKDSVLAWAGKGYDPMKLTPENLLNFYKETYILKKVTEYEDYYVSIEIGTMTVEKFILEGLPFKHLRTSIKLEQKVKVLVEKNVFDFQLKQFANIVMNFWHYFKLETYYDNHRLVFKVNQATFDKVLEVASVLEQKSEGIHITSIFIPIINFF
ncbi:hypothetical protein [Spiroplasma endosymbiont of Megaselia nigra]|uniref:hypothetical protein n=1 Tax=Spiroplasma endosymbiont of Megaselia nigra TaxID=2478537 RepID=UPI0018AD3768|nr:hypothetical protein [Spiroplasma endosymbiont of Megaselia nigra]